MRHGKKFNHLSRKPAHRKAMLSNMANSLIQSKRISTTVAKAKALRKYVEPLITKAKKDTTHSRRVVFSHLQDKDIVRMLFDDVANKTMDRPGGYTRIIKMGNRLGDNADMCMIELVDYNDLMLEEQDSKKSKTRRSRRGGKKKSTTETSATAKTQEKEEVAETETTDVIEDAEVVEETETVEEVKEETPVQEEPAAEKEPEVEEEVNEKPKAQAEDKEEEKEEKKKDSPKNDNDEKEGK